MRAFSVPRVPRRLAIGRRSRRHAAVPAALGHFGAEPFTPEPALSACPSLGWLAGLVTAAGAEGRLPCRDEISPRAIGAAALPTVLLLDLQGTPTRYLIRLVGTELVHLSGRDNTGRFFDEIADQHGGANPFYLSLLDHLMATRQPLLVTANLFYRNRDWQKFRALLSPVAGSGGNVERIVGAFDTPQPEATAAAR